MLSSERPRSTIVRTNWLSSVQPIWFANKIDMWNNSYINPIDLENPDYNRSKTALSHWDGQSMKSNPEDVLAAVRRWNHIGKIVYVVLYILFNIVFWATALSEYVRPAEQYINTINWHSSVRPIQIHKSSKIDRQNKSELLFSVVH